MKPDRKALEKLLDSLKAQVRELEEMLKKPEVMTQASFEVCIEFADKPVPEKDIDTLMGEIESALSDAAERVDGVQERDANVAIEIIGTDRDEVEEEADDE